MPSRETRQTIELLTKQQRKTRFAAERYARAHGLGSVAEIEAYVRRISRRRPPGMAPALVEPPRGPKPLSGGTSAPLEFDD